MNKIEGGPAPPPFIPPTLGLATPLKTTMVVFFLITTAIGKLGEVQKIKLKYPHILPSTAPANF